MDDRRAQFLILVCETCSAAIPAELTVQLEMVGGGCVSGVPTSTTPAAGEDELDHTGYANCIRIAGIEIRLDEVVQFSVTSPIRNLGVPAVSDARSGVGSYPSEN